jgi:hypothetical protein
MPPLSDQHRRVLLLVFQHRQRQQQQQMLGYWLMCTHVMSSARVLSLMRVMQEEQVLRL